MADSFRRLSGKEAVDLNKSMYGPGQADFSYAGHGSSWAGMFTVLDAKFAADSECGIKLQMTGEAFLLEHNMAEGSDKIWSDNLQGDGKNWLGMQLMVIRD